MSPPAGVALVAIAATLGAMPVAARAQPAPVPERDGRELGAGYIGRDIARLEVDDCRPFDGLSEDQLRKQGQEHYQRGETLYLQGDYPGAVREMISSYCLIPFYSILKDIGQAHERNLDYEKAIGYFERYVRDLPDDAKRASPCAIDPQEDKKNVERRIEVLQSLRAHILVETEPKGAEITISNDSGIAGRGKSGQTLEVLGGQYEMVVEREGYETHTQSIQVRIGKPFTYFVGLKPLRGRLSVQVTPADAKVFLRDDTVERFVGIGRVDELLPSGNYVLISEAPGRVRDERPIEVLPDQVNRLQVDLPATPQFGRRQLIAYATGGGAVATGALLFAFDQTSVTVLGSLAGGAAGFFGSYFYLSDSVPLGTSNLAITSSLIGLGVGATGALLATGDAQLVQPVYGATMVLGAGLGYYLGNRWKVQPGDAALINTASLWGTAAGGLFAVAFDGDRRTSAGLVLGGLGMGTVGGILLTQYFDVSRTRAVLIDVGGIIGVIGGLATEGLTKRESSDRSSESIANFALGGMAIGLIGAGILTRNLDAPKIPLKPAIGAASGPAGNVVPTYGLSGSW
ncbi:MAG: PEGA domain-containing protein [Kofleriaceae bacterium]